tara:strand:- start:4515 stop:4685 length:171 start_codon:yes stop_codon:yes gene_type:complete
MVDQAAFQLARPLLSISLRVPALREIPLRQNGPSAPDHDNPDADEIMHVNAVPRRT